MELRPSPARKHDAATRRWYWRLLQARTTHFLFVGLLLFAIAKPARDDRALVVRSRDIPGAKTRAKNAAPPSYALWLAIRDEAMYQEGLRLQLDRSDRVIRNRVIQRMLTLAEMIEGAYKPPTKKELLSYYQKTKARWSKPAKISFAQVFLARSTPERERQIASELAAKYATAKSSAPPLGDAFALPRIVVGEDEKRLTHTYGKDFVTKLFAQKPGAWVGPISSKFGKHFVRVYAQSKTRPLSFQEALRPLTRSYRLHRRHKARQTFTKKLLERYTVKLDKKALSPMRINKLLAEVQDG
jgi:hypothetical protein